jgi:hypothetical protein
MPSLGLGLSTTRGTSPAPSFTPASIANLAVWLDAMDASTVLRDTGSGFVPAANGEAVARWVDKSANAHILAQTTAGSRPLLSTSAGPSSGRCIEWDGVDDFLQKNPLAISRPHTAFVIFTNRSTVVNDVIYHTAGAGAASQLRQLSSTSTGRIVGGPASIPTVANEWAVATLEVETNAYRIRKNNGVLLAETVATAASIGLSLGAQIGPINFAHCALSEFLIYESILSPSDQDKIRNYLKAKWGTP